MRNPYLMDLLDNHVHQNAVGVIVGTLSGDEQLNGHDIRISGNQIVDNNEPGLHREGATTDTVPSGTALVIVGNHRVEISGNTITNHGTNGIAVVSLLFAQIPLDPGIDPFPTDVYVHDNALSDVGATPDMTRPLGSATRVRCCRVEHVGRQPPRHPGGRDREPAAPARTQPDGLVRDAGNRHLRQPSRRPAGPGDGQPGRHRRAESLWPGLRVAGAAAGGGPGSLR